MESNQQKMKDYKKKKLAARWKVNTSVQAMNR